MPYLPPFMTLHQARDEIRPQSPTMTLENMPLPTVPIQTAPKASASALRRASGFGQSPTVSGGLKVPVRPAFRPALRPARKSDTLEDEGENSTPRKKARTVCDSTQSSSSSQQRSIIIGCHVDEPRILIRAKLVEPTGLIIEASREDSPIAVLEKLDTLVQSRTGADSVPIEKVTFNSYTFGLLPNSVEDLSHITTYLEDHLRKNYSPSAEREISQESTASIMFDPPELVVGVHSLDPNIPVYAKIRRSTADRGAVLFNIHKASEDVESSEIEFSKKKILFKDIVFDRKFLADSETEIKRLIRAQFREVKLDVSSDVQMHEVTLGEPDIELETGTNEKEQESGRNEAPRNGRKEEPENERGEKTTEKSVVVAQTVLTVRERLLHDLQEYMGQEERREAALGNVRKELETQREVAADYAKTIGELRSKIAEQESHIKNQESQIKDQKSTIEEQAQTIADFQSRLDGIRGFV